MQSERKYTSLETSIKSVLKTEFIEFWSLEVANVFKLRVRIAFSTNSTMYRKTK